MSTRPLVWRGGWVGLAACIGAFGLMGPALAAPAATDPLLFVSPQHRVQQAKALTQRQAKRPQAIRSDVDFTPPQLTAFNVATAVDVSSSTHQLAVQLKLTDDWSGLSWAFVGATSPSGQQVEVAVPQVGGVTNFSGSTALHFSPFAEVGLWQVDRVVLRDLAGNIAVYTQPELAVLGNTQFTVSGAVVDLTAPVLASGKVLSKWLSLSEPSKGTAGTAPLVRVQLAVTDTGTGGLAGVRNAFVYLCLADASHCFGLRSDEMTLYGLGQATLLAESPLFSDVFPGEYMIRDIDLFDHAGNVRTYVSTAFGGSTDFSALIVPSTIRVKP